MGNFQEEHIDESELIGYLRDDITMTDLVNLKRAFLKLDEDGDGIIEYDTKKLTDIDKYELPTNDPNGKTKINCEQFMNIMIDNITTNRKHFGKEKTVYESETSTVLCFICPFKQ